MENLGMLLYALLMVSALWGAAGLWQGSRYVRRSRQAESVIRLVEQVYEAEEQEAGVAEGMKRAERSKAGSAEQKQDDVEQEAGVAKGLKRAVRRRAGSAGRKQDDVEQEAGVAEGMKRAERREAGSVGRVYDAAEPGSVAGVSGTADWAADVLNWCGMEEGAAEGGGRLSGSLEGDYRRLLGLICACRDRERKLWEEKALEQKDVFMMWTHQIKTPIAALRLLLGGDDRQDRTNFLMREELFKIEQYAEMALSFQRLANMSSDMSLQEYALYPLIRQSVKKYSLLFINKGLQLDLQKTDARVLTDEKWFSFCLEQILSNSIKYTQRGKITISCEEREEGLVLAVEDTGMGIRPEDLPRIFEKGFTGYNGRVDKRASGIGLYLSRRIGEQLGIEIRAESVFGEGTRIELLVPEADDSVH